MARSATYRFLLFVKSTTGELSYDMTLAKDIVNVQQPFIPNGQKPERPCHRFHPEFISVLPAICRFFRTFSVSV